MRRVDVQVGVRRLRHWPSVLTVTLLFTSCGGRSDTLGNRADEHDAGDSDAGDSDAGLQGASRSASDAAAATARSDAGANRDGMSTAPTTPSNVDAGGSAAPPGTAGTSPDSPVIVDNCDTLVQPTSQIRRLTNEQYDRTIRDLLGVTTLATDAAEPPSTLLEPHHADGLDELDWAGYRSAAAAIAERVMSDPALLSNFVRCDLVDRVGCLRETIVRFGRRAFRRPLRESEASAFERLIEVGESAPVEELARVILETFLVSPSFLQRAEVTEQTDPDGRFLLSNHEVAARLSYLLWGSMPDSELDAAADAGELVEAGQILTQAQRMLEDERSSDMVRAFTRDYLGMENDSAWQAAAKDELLFPQFTPEMLPAMQAESELFFERIVGDGGRFADLFSSQVGFVNDQTAVLYGIDPGGWGPDLGQVTLTERPGFLTRVGFLTATSNATRTSPIRRGAFIANRVLGLGLVDSADVSQGSLPAPPPDIDTNRKLVELQTDHDACRECHEQVINPFGFVLEGFNAVGMTQSVEADTSAPIDTLAEVLIDGARIEVRNPTELMEALASSSDARREFARRWITFAYEREADTDDACLAWELADKLADDGYTLTNLIADLTLTPQFRTRSQELSQ